MFKGVCDGVAVGVGVGVQHENAAADQSVEAAVLPRITTGSRGLHSRGVRAEGSGEDELDLDRSNQRFFRAGDGHSVKTHVGCIA